MATRMSLGGLPVLGKSVRMGDVYVGAGSAVLGNALVNYLDEQTRSKDTGKSLLDNLPDAIRPAMGSLAWAALLFFTQKRRNMTRAEGHAAGAIAAGIAFTVRANAVGYVKKAQAESTNANDMIHKINFAGMGVIPGSIQSQAQLTPARLGEVIAIPGTRAFGNFREVMVGPNFQQSLPAPRNSGEYADQRALNGLANWQSRVQNAEAPTP